MCGQASPKEAPADAFEEAFLELQVWADITEEKYALLHAKRLARKGRLAAALKYAFISKLRQNLAASIVSCKIHNTPYVVLHHSAS